LLSRILPLRARSFLVERINGVSSDGDQPQTGATPGRHLKTSDKFGLIISGECRTCKPLQTRRHASEDGQIKAEKRVARD
jgi:hypothetical protein